MSNRIVQSVATFAAIVAISICSAMAADAHLLMYAAKMNAGYRIAKQCNEAVPGFLAGYELHLGAVEAALKPKGINEELRKKAETVPELSSLQYLEKFKAMKVENQLKQCIRSMLEIQEEVLQVQDMGK
jgi:hypothetical protein